MASLDLSWQTYRPAEGFYTSEVTSPRPWPVRTFLPTGYEPRYPYPLLVFLHGKGSNEEQILKLAPRVSRRNFISISLRGPACMGLRREGHVGYSWGDLSNLSLLEDYVLRAIEQTRLNYHIHSERIYLAGFADGATLAYRMGLTFSDKLGGVISLNGAMPRVDRPLFRLPELRALRVFIGHGIANPMVPLTLAQDDYRLLYTAGLNVHMRTYPTTHRIHAEMLKDVNRWVIERCNEEG
jgi:phospholipase/carboxylesterase